MSLQLNLNFSDFNDQDEDIPGLISLINKLGPRAFAVACYVVVEERCLGSEFETAAALDIALAIEDDVVNSNRFLRYVCSEARAQKALEKFEDEVVEDAFWVHGKDALLLKNMVQRALDEKGTVRGPEFFSHHRPRPNSGRRKTVDRGIEP